MAKEKKSAENNQWVSSNTEKTAKSRSKEKDATNNQWTNAHTKPE
ncbi:MAG: hypothetical protein ACRC5C_01965 [Bacilli bacterium]